MKKIAIFLILLISITIFAFKEKEVEVEASGTWVEVAYISGYYFIGSSYNDILNAYNEGNEIYVIYMSQKGRLLYNSANNYFYLEATTGNTIGVGGPSSSNFADCIIGYYYTPKYTVTFKDWNNTTLKSEVVTEGANATPPLNPTRTGYTFTSWSGTYTNVTSNQTVTATYSINQYTVTFVGYDGEVYTTREVDYGSNVDEIGRPSYFPDPYLTSTFNGWFKEQSFTTLFNFTTEVITSDISLYAKFTQNTHTVTFKDYDGTTLKTETIDEGYDATPPSNPSRVGYTFTGWSGTYTNVTSNRTITATYSINTYTVTFVGYDGEVYTTREVDYGSNVDEIGRPSYFPDPYLTSTFNGWFKEQSFTTLFNFTTEVITSDISLYAKFTQNTHTVTFKDYDGTTLKTETIDEGYDATPPSNPSRVGYTFTGWSGTYTNVTSNRTITATYSINTYTVTFVDWNGATLSTQTINYGSNATAPTNPSRTGYTFNGWSGTYTNITSNRTITATYSINTYTVTFVDWNGATLSTQTINYGSNATPPSNPSRIGYTFTGWSGTYTNVTSNQVVTAAYTINEYTITFIDYDSSVYTTRLVEHGSLLDEIGAPDNIMWLIYTFNGWYKDQAFTILFDFDSEVITSDFSLYAKFTRNTYTVTFLDYDGSTLSTQTIEELDDATPPSSPSRVGYTFTGWTGTYTNVTSNQVVTAAYTINEYTITFIDYDSSVYTTRLVEHGSLLDEIGAPDNIMWLIYTFNGWYKDQAFTILFDFDSEVITSDFSLYAKFTRNTYTVTFLDYDGSTLSTQTIEELDDATPPSSPSRVGYTFTGWTGTYTNVTSNQVVTAAYTINEYRITFINHDGSVYTIRDVEHGTFYVIDFPNPVLLAFSFQGWFKEDTYINEFDFENESIVTDITLYAKLVKLQVYVVQFLFYDDTVLKTQYVEQGLSATPPPNPLRDGYIFDGWDKDYTNVTSDLNVKAIYTLNTTPNEQEPIQFQYMYIVYGMGGLVGLSLLLSIFKRKKRGYRR